MGKRREPTEAEKIAEQREQIKDALENGKTELDLRTDSMDVLREACAIKTLTKLTLKIGKLTSLPRELGQLEALESFHIDSNEITTLPDEIGALTRVHTFYAYSNKIKALPETFGGMKSLKKLVLWQNQLTTLPKSFGDLKKLTECEIKWNKITKLPDSINGLENLEELDACSNELTDLPRDLSGMKKLRRLKLEQNKLKAFPEGLFTLPALVELEMGENQITEIPDDITRMKKLAELDLNQNKIKELPKKLFSMPLTSLKLRQNQLKTLPKELAGMPMLAELELYGNTIAGIDDDLSRKSKNEIFQALGWWKPRIAPPPPADPEKATALKSRATALEKFNREAKRRGGEKLVKLIAFLNGKSDEVPPPALDDEYHLAAITEALAPFAEWNFIDRRILAFITQDAWRFKHPGQDYFSGFDEGFFRWLEPQIEAEPEGSTLFSDVAKEVFAFGIGEAPYVDGALRKLDDAILKKDTGATTSFGRYMIDVARRNVDIVLAQDRDSVKEALIGLLVRHAKDVFAQLGDRLLRIAPDEDGDIHIPYDALDHACAMEPARFEKLLMEGIEKTTCDPCRAEAARVLLTRFPKHKERALEITKKTLARIAERKNKEERYEFYWSGGGHWEDGTAEYIDWALDKFGDAVKPDIHKLVEDTKVFSLDVAEVLAKRFGQSAIDTLAEGLKMTVSDDDIAPHFRRMFTMLAPLDWSKYHDLAWGLARSEHKKVRETACLALGRLDAKVVLPKAKELLEAKRGHEREAGVLLLTLIDHPEAKKLLTDILETEKSDDARDLVAKTFFKTKCDKREADRRVQSAKARGKLDKPIAKWLDEKKLPKIADPLTLRFLAYRQTRQTEIAIDPEARGVFDLIDKKKSGEFAKKLLDLVVKNGGVAAKNRFALVLVGVFGDKRVIETLEKIATDDRNENACHTLGLITSDAMDAARALDRIMKVFRVKYPNVRGAAEEAFDAIAERMGKTPFELADAMISDFGMKNGRIVLKGLKIFATIDDRQKVGFVDAKYAPAKPPAKAPVIKELQDAVKESARQLKNNLEYYLIVRRRWDMAAFSAFFETNPLAFSFARGFVWGSYDGAKLVSAFRVTRDAEHVGVDGKVVKLPKTAQIALVHPLELDATERAKWLAALAAAQVVPAFPQLDRPTFSPNDEERVRAKCFRFEDKELASLTFKGRAERRGWRRGSVVDSGEVSAYRKMFPHDKIEVFIGTEGMNVTSYADEGEVTLKDLFFVRPGAVVTGSYTYDEPRDEDDDRLIRLSDVPPIVFSEVVADLVAITKEKEEAEA